MFGHTGAIGDDSSIYFYLILWCFVHACEATQVKLSLIPNLDIFHEAILFRKSKVAKHDLHLLIRQRYKLYPP